MLIKKHGRWLIPILCMLIITPFTPWLDLYFEQYFYDHNAHTSSHFMKNEYLDFIFDFAPLPAEILGILAFVFLILSYISPFWKRWQKPFLLLVLLMAIGAGALVHAVFKDHWGRPRPVQVIQFGGTQEFRPFYKPNFFNQPESSKSFPCGHCSMGFYFFGLSVIALRYKKRTAFIFATLFAIFMGLLLGITRMAQGGHFFSDVLMCALIMWLTALVIDWVLYGPEQSSSRRSS